MHQLLTSKKEGFEKAVEHLRSELAGLRTGRASTGLVEGLQVMAYGSAQEMRNLASISTPDSRTIRIEPWDAGVVNDIEKAIADSDIGISPNVDGKIIRLSIQPMTEDSRKELVKVVGKRVEEARIVVRNVREEVRKEIEVLEKSKEIREDERYQMQEDLDKMVSEYNSSIETMGKEKETQISTV